MAWHPLFRLRRLAAVRRLAAWLDRPVRRRLPGLAFPIWLRLGPNLSLLLASRRSEPEERALFGRLVALQRTRCLWDVGANVGLYLFDFVGRRPEAEALAVEPDPGNLACLRRTLRDQRLERVEIVAAAVAERTGRQRFQSDPVTGATGGLEAEGLVPFVTLHYGMAVPVIEVETLRLDDLLDGRQPPDLVKLDIEGGELPALRGAPRLLSEVRPVLLLEVSARRDETVALLRAAGYRLYDARTLQPDRGEAWNLLALPSEGPLAVEALR
ncbi:methyltransferase, FkbM family [Tistlia consotensis]|uniref:Methyltransferase, FkbM family n=1 Tax=Tistlia consotensis USBA 355 TaxID=560819 RepID=A0A1Y6B6Z0_9PROT|nr:FkbM family methyltransferase [Tistlia consotensis]SME91517.1 methyltransferase, FkbM family [Tistlia consotensis USBA 355]SNR27406.1 methyltransferase, FkbM family [Tistlia consotensis]